MTLYVSNSSRWRRNLTRLVRAGNVLLAILDLLRDALRRPLASV